MLSVISDGAPKRVWIMILAKACQWVSTALAAITRVDWLMQPLLML